MVECEDDYKQKVLESYLNSLPYNIWIKDDKHRYVYANDHYLKLIGFTYEEVIGKTDFEIFSLYNAVLLFKQDMKVLKTHEALSFQYKVKYDSKEKYYENYKAPLSSSGKKSNWIYTIEKEVTLEKNREKSIKSSIYDFRKYKRKKDNYYNRILNISNNLMEKIKADGISIMLYNDYKSQLSMYLCIAKDKKIKTQYVIELNEYELNILQDSRNAIYNNYKINDNNTMRNINIKTYGICYDNEMIGILNIHYDIKNKNIINCDEFITCACDKYAVLLKNRLLSQSLNKELIKRRESDEILELFLGTAADLCGVIKTNEYGHACFEKLTWKWLDIFGYKKEELYKVRVIDMIHPDDKENVEYLFKHKRCIMKRRGMNIRFKCKNGKYKEIEWSFQYLKAEDKIVFTGKDVTENQYLCLEKKRLTEKAHVKEIKTKFFSNMSHEFETPLNIILSTAQLISNNISEKKLTLNDAYNSVWCIRKNSYRLLHLVNNLIDTAKIERKSFKLNLINSNIVEAVEDVVDSIINYIEKNSKRNIIFDTEEEEIITCFDIERIGKVVYNLMSYAIKFTEQNGNIIVKVFMDEKKKNVIVSVYDDGNGSKKETAEVLFDKFVQDDYFLTKNEDETGIGLYLTKSIIELHGGKIGINKNIKDGSEIYFSLPLKQIETLDTNIYYSRSIDAQIEMCNIELSNINM